MKAVEATEDTIVQEISIKRPAKWVFDALTNPKKLVEWWGVDGKFQAIHAECNVRVGGKWRMRVMGSGGKESVVAGVYRKIKRPSLLVYTWIREDDGIETLVRWDLEEKNGVTTVRVTHSGLKSETLRARNNGWPIVLGLLKTYAED